MQEMQVKSLGQEDSSGGENGKPLQDSCLENSMERGVWWAAVRRVAKSQTRLSTHAHPYRFVSKFKPWLRVFKKNWGVGSATLYTWCGFQLWLKYHYVTKDKKKNERLEAKAQWLMVLPSPTLTGSKIIRTWNIFICKITEFISLKELNATHAQFSHF